ncbi:MAG: RNA polymerase sigma factor [Flavobacteriales bacterium]
MVWRSVFPAVNAILRNKEEAEDAMQDSIIKGFAKLSELKDAEKYPGWQKQISVRHALGLLRQRKDIIKLFEDVPDGVETDDGNALLQMDVGLVHQKLNHMPDGYRMSIQLHLIDGMSHDEIGDALGIAASTSRSQYSRGIAQLKKELLAEYEKQI